MAGRPGEGSELAVRGDAVNVDELKGPAEVSGPDLCDGVRFQVLGPVRAWRGDRPLDLGPPQQRAVLAMLLLHAGRPVSVPQLVDALWEEEPPPRAVGTLRTYVSRLRALLEPDRKPRQEGRLLVSSGGGYALRVPAGALDAAAFEERLGTARRLRAAGDTAGAYAQLSEALALPAGVALAGLPGPYAERQRDRLTELCVTAQEELFDCVVQLGGAHAGAVADSIAGLRAFAAEHPLRERPQALLMLALHRAGRRAEALAVYEATRRTLADELGAEPGNELRLLYRELRAARNTRGGPAPRDTRDTRDGRGNHAGHSSRYGQDTRDSPGRRDVHTTHDTHTTPATHHTPAPRDQRPYPPRLARDISCIAPPPPVPAQLPPDTADFTGRAEPVAHLAAALRGAADGRAPVVAALSGLGGVGKTALAVHVAHAVRGHFPDGQLYVDLQGTGPAPVDSGAVLTRFLRALGVAPGSVPDGPAEKAALYRSLIADRKVLVLLDNARDSAQIRPLLPGVPGCAVLVTSRARTLALPGAGGVHVEEMDEGEALGLLGAVAGAERVAAEADAARELVALCGGLPLAVRIAAARLASRPGRSLTDLVARLSEERRLNELRVGDLGVEATFRLGYEALAPGLAHAFRALALSGPPAFCRAAAAALLDTTDDEAEAAVEELVDAGLVEPHGDDGYRYHELVGLFARRLGERQDSPRERAAAQRRYVDHLLATVLTAVRLIEPIAAPRPLPRRPDSPARPLAGADAARAWLHEAHPRLYATVQRALDAAPELLAPAVDLLTAWSRALSGSARHRDLAPLVRLAVDSARRQGDDRAAARARRLLGVPRHATDPFGRARRMPREGLPWASASALPRAGAPAAHRAVPLLRPATRPPCRLERHPCPVTPIRARFRPHDLAGGGRERPPQEYAQVAVVALVLEREWPPRRSSPGCSRSPPRGAAGAAVGAPGAALSYHRRWRTRA
ncbi:BTAD domain-containing putative transcriptional regulator [Streptomyces sp. NPDC058773]|uniref:AfsR/SARP family transcriptional regulator n=1 Tax=Streptomyces sp. NPDC058773 TaxID=3346632 RepID=UPI0036792C38